MLMVSIDEHVVQTLKQISASCLIGSVKLTFEKLKFERAHVFVCL